MAVKNLFDFLECKIRTQKNNTGQQKKNNKTKKRWSCDEDFVTVSLLFHFVCVGTPYTKLTFFFKVKTEHTLDGRGPDQDPVVRILVPKWNIFGAMRYSKPFYFLVVKNRVLGKKPLKKNFFSKKHFFPSKSLVVKNRVLGTPP